VPIGEAECADGECKCDFGHAGPDCQIDERSATTCKQPSILGIDGRCCASGILSYDGECCEGENGEVHLDVEGKCCDIPLNGCGKCSEEKEFMDSSGVCCKVKRLSSGLVAEAAFRYLMLVERAARAARWTNVESVMEQGIVVIPLSNLR